MHLEVADLEASGVEIVDAVTLPADVSAEVARLVEQRSTVGGLRAELAASTRRAAADLRRRGFSTRDVGELLGVSGARVAQMDREPHTD